MSRTLLLQWAAIGVAGVFVIWAANAGSSSAGSKPQLSDGARAAIEKLKTAPIPTAYHKMDMSIPDIRPFRPLAPDVQKEFESQWHAAQHASAHFDTPEEAIALGYLPPREGDRGKLGVHWINWELVMQPFDPARPSMLIFGSKDGKEMLIGYSYTVQSIEEPGGFAGDNDVWHRHSGVCLLNGQVIEDGIPPWACASEWIPGSDLWMLHAWVLPDYPNPLGRFSVSNVLICPDGTVCPVIDPVDDMADLASHGGH